MVVDGVGADVMDATTLEREAVSCAAAKAVKAAETRTVEKRIVTGLFVVC